MSSKSRNYSANNASNRPLIELQKSIQIVENTTRLQESIRQQKEVLKQLKDIMEEENVDDVFNEFNEFVKEKEENLKKTQDKLNKILAISEEKRDNAKGIFNKMRNRKTIRSRGGNKTQSRSRGSPRTQGSPRTRGSPRTLGSPRTRGSPRTLGVGREEYGKKPIRIVRVEDPIKTKFVERNFSNSSEDTYITLVDDKQIKKLEEEGKLVRILDNIEPQKELSPAKKPNFGVTESKKKQKGLFGIINRFTRKNKNPK
jgi:hypothetical protein